MISVGKNIIANMTGRAFSALFTFIFVPVYLKYLGVEAYGLIGFYLTLQMILLLADMGFSGAITREVARQSTLNSSNRDTANLCHTFEFIYIAIGIIIAIVVLVASGIIVDHWINASSISNDEAQQSIVLMGLVIGLQLPALMYQGVLNGLQKQIALNIVLILIGLARGLGAVVVLHSVEASLEAYFGWQVVVSVCQIAIFRSVVWRQFDRSNSKLDWTVIKPLFRFATGMALIAASTSVLTQADKLIVSKMFSLETFGYYSLAGILASVPMLIAGPIHNAIFPRFTQIIAQNDVAKLSPQYHRICQLVAVLSLPIGIVVIVFSKELVHLWTGDVSTANNTYMLASTLAIGSTLLTLMYIPYALQLAFGWTSLALIVNSVAIVVLVPLTIWSAGRYGIIGAASTWVVLNVGYVLGMIHFMHKRILRSEIWNWYVNDVSKPFLATIIVIAGSRWFFDPASSDILRIGWIAGTLLGSMVLAALSAPLLRSLAVVSFQRWRCRRKKSISIAK